MNKKLRLMLILLFASIFLFSGWKLTQALLGYRESADSYTTLEQYISFDTTMNDKRQIAVIPTTALDF